MNQELFAEQATFTMIAKTLQGLEEVLAGELTALGANDVQIGHRMVSFTGDKRLLYLTNFSLHTALRILKPIKHFQARNADEVYEEIKAVEWENYLTEHKTFAVDSVVFSEEFRHSMFVSYKAKDAIADYFREKTGNRPSVRLKNPDVLINVHIHENDCTLSLDSSGESLHLRGYRKHVVEAPLNPVLAAGLIMMTGWHGECDLIDPMCGSGTIPIEAALIARNMSPGLFRTEGYAFERWNDFDKELLEEIYNDDSQEREFAHRIYAMDNNPKAVASTRENVKLAGMGGCIEFALRALQDMEQPAKPAIMITNPPYGERITAEGGEILELYRSLGERLKHAFVGNQAWVLSYRDECFDEIGLKPTKKIDILNGDLECQFREYEIFNGRYQAFREQGDSLDKETEPERPRRKRYADKDPRLSRDERRQLQIKRIMGQNSPETGGEERPPKKEWKERKPWEKGDRRPPFAKREDRKPWERDDKRPPFAKREDRKPWERDDRRPPFTKREDRKPWERDDRRPPFAKREDRKPWNKDERRKFFDKKMGGKPNAPAGKDFKRRPQESYPERKRREQQEQTNNA